MPGQPSLRSRPIDARAAALGVAALAPRWTPLRVRGRPRAGARRPALHRGSAGERARRRRGRVRRGRRDHRGRVPHAGADPPRARGPLRRRRLGAGRAAHVDLDAGHLRRARRARAELRPRSRSRARDLRVHGRRIRREAGRHDRGICSRPISRASPVGPSGSSTTAAARASPPAIALPPSRPTGSARAATARSRRSRRLPWSQWASAGCSCRRCSCRRRRSTAARTCVPRRSPFASTSASRTRTARPA